MPRGIRRVEVRSLGACYLQPQASGTMPRFKVFLGAPSLDELTSTEQPGVYTWSSIPCEVPPAMAKPSQEQSRADSFSGFLPVTLEAASRRISMLYENIIFRNIDSEEGFTDHEGAGVLDATRPDVAKDMTRNTQGGFETHPCFL